MAEVLGKIDIDFFKKNIFNQCGFKRKEVLKGASFGVDVAVVTNASEV